MPSLSQKSTALVPSMYTGAIPFPITGCNTSHHHPSPATPPTRHHCNTSRPPPHPKEPHLLPKHTVTHVTHLSMTFCFTKSNNQTPVLNHFRMSESCGGEDSGQRNLSGIFVDAYGRGWILPVQVPRGKVKTRII